MIIAGISYLSLLIIDLGCCNSVCNRIPVFTTIYRYDSFKSIEF